MPIYDYDCAACGRRLEVIHGVHAPGPTHCPNCGGGPLRKAIAAPAVHFKGSGWAKRDRRAGATTGHSKATTDAPVAADGQATGAGRASGDEPSSGGTEGGEPRAAGDGANDAGGSAGDLAASRDRGDRGKDGKDGKDGKGRPASARSSTGTSSTAGAD